MLFSGFNFGFSEIAGRRIGVVLLHGKRGFPGEKTLFGLKERMGKEGIIVDMPEMPWSKERFIDADYSEAFNEIALSIGRLKNSGAVRIVIAGHSMGANAALAYGAYRDGISGVIMLAPGHITDSYKQKTYFADSLEAARGMVSEGKGEENGMFKDENQGRKYEINIKASVYISYFDPDGMGSMMKSASKLSPEIPLLMIAGSRDMIEKSNYDKEIFSLAPTNQLSHYIIVDADHMQTPNESADHVIDWLERLP
jgi:pimeloyl-ACP methyl ester carboxylesterase